MDLLNKSKKKLMKNNQKMFGQYEKIHQGIQNVPTNLTSYCAQIDQMTTHAQKSTRRTSQPNQSPNNRSSGRKTSPSPTTTKQSV